MRRASCFRPIVGVRVQYSQHARTRNEFPFSSRLSPKIREHLISATLDLLKDCPAPAALLTLEAMQGQSQPKPAQTSAGRAEAPRASSAPPLAERRCGAAL